MHKAYLAFAIYVYQQHYDCHIASGVLIKEVFTTKTQQSVNSAYMFNFIYD